MGSFVEDYDEVDLPQLERMRDHGLIPKRQKKNVVEGIAFCEARTGHDDIVLVCERCGAVVLPGYIHHDRRPSFNAAKVHAEWHHSNDHNLEGLT